MLDHADTEVWKKPEDPLLTRVSKLLTHEMPQWEGSAAELSELLGGEIKPNILTRRLNIKADNLKEKYKVEYRNKHTALGSYICLKKLTE